MDILSTISTTSHAVDTIYKIATYNWNKKTITRLVIASIALASTIVVINVIESRRKE